MTTITATITVISTAIDGTTITNVINANDTATTATISTPFTIAITDY